MFSKGDYHRYLFEIGSAQRRVRQLYDAVAGGTSSDAVKPAVVELLDELAEQDKALDEIKALFPDES